MSYSFRIRFNLPESVSIGFNSFEWVIKDSHAKKNVVLRSWQKDTNIQDVRKLVIRGDGYDSEREAQEEGSRYRAAFTLAFARLRIGADFGNRAPKGSFTEYGLKMLEEQTGFRLLNDTHGLMTFITEPTPQFVDTHVNPVLTKPKDKFAEAINFALKNKLSVSEQDQLAFDLFSSSFFQPSADARFLMLMMAVETLLEPVPRSNAAQEHVSKLISLTKDSILSQSEKDSLIGSLQWLYKESISQTGRKLAKRLGERKYHGKEPSQFFNFCYNLRSKLVHGSMPRPTRDEVGIASAALESFVGDLLCGPLTSIEY